MPLFSRGPAKPKKPERPKAPPKPSRKEPVIVRNYHKEGFGSEKKIAKAFEDDARRLARDGYIPSQTAAQGPKAASLLLGGLGMIKGGHLTVTYVLSPESKAADAEMQAAYDAFKRDEKRLMAEWQEDVRRWEAECAEIDRAYAASRQPVPVLAEPVPAELPAAQLDVDYATAAVDVSVSPARVDPGIESASAADGENALPAVDVLERLKALAELRTIGIVSEAEYETKRVELLARL
jgi:hypothetical protein